MHVPIRSQRSLGLLLLGVLLCAADHADAQTFNSGSTGALGAFNPASNTTVTLPPDGILNYTTVTIPVGVTVTFAKNAANTPVTMLATGDVMINGTIAVNGSLAPGCGAGQAPGGASGPGGLNGGRGGALGAVNNEGSTGQGPGGGTLAGHGTYGAPTNFVALIPLFGGSGASGSNGSVTTCGLGGSGGGGAIAIASTTNISITGSVTANGGPQPPACATGLSGSGGAIRLVASFITVPGTLEARAVPDPGSPGCFGGSGRIRLEAFTYGVVPSSNPAPSVVNTPGPVTVASTPALVNPPTVTITAIGAQTPSATPGGSYAAPDVTMPGGTTNPVVVTVTATNTPVGSVFQIKAMPPSGQGVMVNTAPSTGTVASSTATANVSLPTSVTSVLNVYGSYILPP